MIETADYTGRLVDLFIFQQAKLRGEQKLQLGFGTEGQITTGIQKLAQTFTILFLTEIGSVPQMPARGTSFVTAVRQGRIIDESAVQAEFAVAVDQVRAILDLEAEATNPPPDETFASAVLERFVLDKVASNLILYVLLTSAAGTEHNLFIPLPVH